MERDKFHLIRVGRPNFCEDLTERNELAAFLVDVLLVDFIGNDADTVRVSEHDDLLDIFFRQNLASRVSWVDDNDRTWLNTHFFGKR